jgi:hypothetical protein
MRNIAIFLVLTGLHFQVLCQNLQIDWQTCLGGSESDYAMDMLELENGYLILGNTYSNDGDISNNHGVNDLWLVRVDSTGSILWERSYGGSESDGSSRILYAGENNFYILGTAFSSDGDISNDPYPDTPDYWIVKIDSTGAILWDKIVGGNQGEVLFTGSPTIDGGVIAIGHTYSNDGDVSVNYGGADTWMVKISSDGELEWDFTIGTDWIDKGQAVIQTSDGGYLAESSSMLGNGGNITCEPHSSYTEGVLFKLDADRNIEWQRCYGGSDHDGIFGLLEIEDGYVFIGSTSSNDGDVSGWHGGSDAWVVKIDSLGNIIWQNPLGGSRSESGANILQTLNNGFVVIVSTQSNDGNVSGNHSLSEYDTDIWIVKLSSEGELLLQQCIGGAGNESVDFGVVKKSDNNFVIAGQTDWGPSYDVQCTPHGGIGDKDFWVFEIEDTSTNVIGQVVNNNGLKIYPNPAEDYIVFEVNNSKNYNQNLIITNSFGQQIAVLSTKNEKVVWDTRNILSGIYFYSYITEIVHESGKIVIK